MNCIWQYVHYKQIPNIFTQIINENQISIYKITVNKDVLRILAFIKKKHEIEYKK